MNNGSIVPEQQAADGGIVNWSVTSKSVKADPVYINNTNKVTNGVLQFRRFL
jgi:hypothetical protein